MCLLGLGVICCQHLYPQGLYWDYSPWRSGWQNDGWSQHGFSWALLQLSAYHWHGPKMGCPRLEIQRKCLHIGNVGRTFLVQIYCNRRSLLCSLGLLALREALPHLGKMEVGFWSLKIDLEGSCLGLSPWSSSRVLGWTGVQMDRGFLWQLHFGGFGYSSEIEVGLH